MPGPTLLILGARASAPYGFPVGRALRDKIINDLSVPGTTVEIFKSLGFTHDAIRNFGDALWTSGCNSVDELLQTRQDLLTIGKAAIALALIPYESEDGLFNMKNSEDWYAYLFGPLLSDLARLEQKGVSVITFNYDRSLEQFLFRALKSRHSSPDAVCRELVAKIPIVHIYGTLGPLPWQIAFGSAVTYTGEVDEATVDFASRNIEIIHESEDDTPLLEQARRLIQDATQIRFLGFGYHETNLRRLGIDGLRAKDPIGTCYGLTPEEFVPIGHKINAHLVPKRVLPFLRTGGMISL